jgi:transposase
VTQVAMESTGVFWKPVYNLLEGLDFTLLVVNAKHIKAVPGRKTDVKDAEWIADLLRHGLLQGSYIPDRSQRELRELVRYRRNLIRQRAQVVNRIQQVLEGANIKLSSVATDITGASGREMLDACATRVWNWCRP